MFWEEKVLCRFPQTLQQTGLSMCVCGKERGMSRPIVEMLSIFGAVS